MPACGYRDPLGGWDSDELQAGLGWAVDVPTKFCLQGGDAVKGLTALAPWFGGGASAADGRFCADGLELSYKPLQVGGWGQGRQGPAWEGVPPRLCMPPAEPQPARRLAPNRPTNRINGLLPSRLPHRPMPRRACLCPPTAIRACRWRRPATWT